MQVVAVPLYSQEMTVEAYMFRELKENLLFSAAQTINIFDGASTSESLSMLNQVGLDAFTLGKPIFIPIKEMMLMGNLQSQCQVPAEKIIFILEEPLSNQEQYLPLARALCGQGYRFAANYPVNFQQQDDFLALCSYVFLSQRPERLEETGQALALLPEQYPNLAPIAFHIYDKNVLAGLYGKGYHLYESRFYRVTTAGSQIGPLKVNAIRLINTVQDENFDFDSISSVVQGDPVLTISLLKLVNALGSGKKQITSIPQAVALLGQQDVRKWVTTAVAKSLGDDRPNEVTRTSLLRARFCENLAPLFEMAHMAGELFLLGLFSVLDVLLETPMEKAIQQVSVTENIRKALVDRDGIFWPVLSLVTDYEIAGWSSVSRKMILHNMDDKDLSQAYLDALTWYRDLISVDEEKLKAQMADAAAASESEEAAPAQ